MRVATWNVNSVRVRLAQLLDWLADAQPDLVALQETKVADADFPVAALAGAGYTVLHNGQPAYNGVALLARGAFADPVHELVLEDPQRRLIAATCQGLRAVCVYVPNGAAVDSDKYAYKLRWLAALRAYLAVELKAHPRLLVLGDYNIAPEDRDVHDPAAWAGHVLVSPAERAAFCELLALGLGDAYRICHPEGHDYTWWDYRQGAFRRNAGLRIDHILVGPALARACRDCRVDRRPRRLERPSDHAPLILELDV